VNWPDDELRCVRVCDELEIQVLLRWGVSCALRSCFFPVLASASQLPHQTAGSPASHTSHGAGLAAERATGSAPA